MLNRSASLAMSTCVLKALPGKLDIKRHSPSIHYIWYIDCPCCVDDNKGFGWGNHTVRADICDGSADLLTTF